MVMPSTGPLSLGGTSSPVSVAQELGLSLTATISMNQANVRTLAGVGGSGTQWSMNSLYGKSNAFTLTYASPVQNADFRAQAVAAGWNQSSAVIVNINSGVYLWSDSTASPGATTGGAFPGGLTVNNAGNIIGKGGNGGSGRASPTPPTYTPAATSGGPAFNLTTPITLNNTGFIAGGGGGGSFCGGPTTGRAQTGGGGGAGGGTGGTVLTSGVTAVGGAGGAIGASGSNGSAGTTSDFAGGGGGRILPGVGGAGGGNSGAAGGSGGNAGSAAGPITINGHGGGGGAGGGGAAWFATGRPPGSASGGGGGGWGAAGGTGSTQGTITSLQGSGGRAINLNANSITYTAPGTIYGSVA